MYCKSCLDIFFYDRECLQLCFMHIIQNNFMELVDEWNSHNIRHSCNSSVEAGIPNALYYMPELCAGGNLCLDQ